MELFREARWLLILLISVSLYFPLNVPMVVLAYKIHWGPKTIALTGRQLWVQSLLVALGLTVLSYLVLGLDYLLVAVGLRSDVVHLVFLVLYVVVAVWYVSWMFRLAKPLEAFNLLLIYVGLPGLILALLLWFHFDPPLWLAEAWLPKPS